jgi:hypothetical protein
VALARARVAALKDDPALAERVASFQAKEQLLTGKLDAHPDMVKADQRQQEVVAEFDRVTKRMQQLQLHMDRHGKPRDIYGDRRQVIRTDPASPVKGCEFCAQDFQKLVASDAALIDGYRKEVSALDAAHIELGLQVRKCETDRPAIAARLKAEDPELRRMAAELAAVEQSVADGIAKRPEMRALAAQVEALKHAGAAGSRVAPTEMARVAVARQPGEDRAAETNALQ